MLNLNVEAVVSSPALFNHKGKRAHFWEKPHFVFSVNRRFWKNESSFKGLKQTPSPQLRHQHSSWVAWVLVKLLSYPQCSRWQVRPTHLHSPACTAQTLPRGLH